MFSEIITTLAKLPISQGVFTFRFKLVKITEEAWTFYRYIFKLPTHFTRLLKKPGLLTDTPSNYHPTLPIYLLKKPGLLTDTPSNYHPTSNLNNISKIPECLLLNHIKDHISSSSNLNPFQSAHQKYYSTETSLLLTLDNIYISLYRS